MPESNASVVRTLAYTSLSGDPSGTAPSSEDARSRRQAREYINGITRQRRWLNFIIDSSYSGSRELDSSVRTVLQIGLYDLLFLSTPEYAAINDAVNLARKVSGAKVTGLVNAVLRRVQRQGLPEPSTSSDVTNLAIRNSHPDWMVERWIRQFGMEGAKDLLEYNNKRPRHCLRVNRTRVTREEVISGAATIGVELQAAQYLDDFVYTSGLQELLASKMFQDGWFTVQDESAGLVVAMADPRRGQTIIDLCSSPGGKTGYMLELLNGECRMIAIDKESARLDLVRDSVSRIGFSNVEYHTADATKLESLPLLPEADLVLIDAPCSGLGVLSKRADMRWRRTERQMRDLVNLQDALLDSAANKVKPGGSLVYSTCTIDPTENDDRVDAFLTRNTLFEMKESATELEDFDVFDGRKLRTLPHVHGIDGAFAVNLRKKVVE